MIRASARAVWHTLEEEKRKEKDTRLSQTRDDNRQSVRQMEDLKHCILELIEQAEHKHLTHTDKIEAVHQGIAIVMECTKGDKTSEVKRERKSIQEGKLSLEMHEVCSTHTNWVTRVYAKKLLENEERKCALFTGCARINDMRKKLERGRACHFISGELLGVCRLLWKRVSAYVVLIKL